MLLIFILVHTPKEIFQPSLIFEGKAQSMELLGIIASFPHHSFYHGETFQPSLIFEGNDNSIELAGIVFTIMRFFSQVQYLRVTAKA